MNAKESENKPQEASVAQDFIGSGFFGAWDHVIERAGYAGELIQGMFEEAHRRICWPHHVAYRDLRKKVDGICKEHLDPEEFKIVSDCLDAMSSIGTSKEMIMSDLSGEIATSPFLRDSLFISHWLEDLFKKVLYRGGLGSREDVDAFVLDHLDFDIPIEKLLPDYPKDWYRHVWAQKRGQEQREEIAKEGERRRKGEN